MQLTNQKRDALRDAVAKTDRPIIAIDPGASGAVAYLNAGRLDVRRDFKHLSLIARAIKGLYIPGSIVIIEDVHAMPGQGVCSMFSFGDAYGVAKGAAWVVMPEGHPVEIVSPLKWQNFFRRELQMVKGEQFSSQYIACWLFPEYVKLFEREKDHNTADAVLIGVWRAVADDATNKPRHF